MAWPAVLGAAAGIASIVSGGRGNRARRKEAKRDRSFQERMSSTSWQRGVADMEAAGINPALAYQQGGASSPSGAMAQQENVGEEAAGTAVGVRVMQEQMKQIKAQTKAAEAQADKTGHEADRQRADNMAWGFSKRPDGSLKMDMSMPNIMTKVQQDLRTGAAQASLANMSLTNASKVQKASGTPYIGQGAAFLQMLRGMGPNINLGMSRSLSETRRR